MDHQQAAQNILSQVMRTGELFPDDLPIARKSDPLTSKLAGVRYSANKLKNDKKMMFDLVQKYPDHTAAELSAILLTLGINWYRAARITTKRISDIRHLIEVTETRKCRITGEYARTYRVIDGVEYAPASNGEDS